MQCNWSEITSSAYLSVLETNAIEFPIPTSKVKCKGVRIVSYQKYSEITNTPIEQLTLSGELEDAFLLKNLRKDVQIILYNDKKSGVRLKHTIWHEIGHVKLDHKKHGNQEEIEAHFFAAQANAPNIFIKTISQRGYKIDLYFLTNHFGLSKESANKKLYYLKKYGFKHINEFDEALLSQFSNYIKEKYPVKTKNFYDDYFDGLEKERANWI